MSYTYGTCRYCGQVVSLEREHETEDATNIAAAEECSCYDARAERAVIKQKTRRGGDFSMSEYKPMKLYLVKHAEYGETTVNGRTRYEAVIAAAKKWGARWTQIARECEFIELAVDDTPGGSR